MVLRVLPRLTGLTAKQIFVLNRYFMKNIIGYTELDADDGSGTYTWTAGEIQLGSTGQVETSEPYTFRDAGATFATTMIGMYLVTWGSSHEANNGVWRIQSVANSNELSVVPTIYGPYFVTDLGIQWAILDLSAVPVLTNPAFYVLQAPTALAGTTPAWQVKFECQVADTSLYRFEVAPMGGYNVAGHNFPGGVQVCSQQQFDFDTTPVAYLAGDESHTFAWTENTASTAVFDCMYAGSGQTFRGAYDPSFALGIAGSVGTLPTDIFASFESMDTTNAGLNLYGGLKPVTTFSGGPPANADSLMIGLPDSQFDLRRDVCEIPVASNAGASEIRGVLRSFYQVSDTTTQYRRFVNNNRTLVSLGNGMCVAWNGSLAV